MEQAAQAVISALCVYLVCVSAGSGGAKAGEYHRPPQSAPQQVSSATKHFGNTSVAETLQYNGILNASEASQHGGIQDDGEVLQHSSTQGAGELVKHNMRGNMEVTEEHDWVINDNSSDNARLQYNRNQSDSEILTYNRSHTIDIDNRTRDVQVNLQCNKSQDDVVVQFIRGQVSEIAQQHNRTQPLDLQYNTTQDIGMENKIQNIALQENKTQDVAVSTQKHEHSEICDLGDGEIKYLEEEYSLVNDTHRIITIQHHTTIAVNVTDIDTETTDFLIFQAHSQNHYLILSHAKRSDCYTNSTDPGLVLWTDDFFKCHSSCWKCQVFLTNCHNRNITVLFMVQNYSSHDPIPGKYKSPCIAQPFLNLDPNLLTTEITYRAAAGSSWKSEAVVRSLHYETFLTYMYERDLSEAKYWDTLIATSTLQGLRKNAKSVAVRVNNDSAELLSTWLVSYSGVGAVVTVVVSYNGSNGTLYSSAVSYGCNFIDAEEYRCTKLVTVLAKVFCASLFFIGAVLLFVGHRWLNFTMFTSGFFFSWCMLFLIFAQDTNSTIDGLGWGTLVGAVMGGVLSLVVWHKFQRPFHSSLLIIMMAVAFVGMVVTYFLRFAIVPDTSNLSAFVVFPVFFALIIIGYSIIDIKKVHIFSCTLLGSYAFIVPFAFYFGSSLTYIVINVLGLMTVKHYPDTVGYPPFQVCDIILLCLWVVLFGAGMAYQLYRERASPPFHPPNLTSWKNFKKSMNFVFNKIFACLPMDPDPGGIDSEDQPDWLLRVVYTSKLVWRRLTCNRNDLSQSGYESFPRMRNLSQHTQQDSNTSDSRLTMVIARLREWKGRIQHHLRGGGRGGDGERLLQESEEEEHLGEEEEKENNDENQLLEGSVSCCAFRNSQVVLDDTYTTTT